MKRVAVFTSGRQDFGILRSTIVLLQKYPTIKADLWAGGMHLGERFGNSIEQIRKDGFTVARQLAYLSEPPEVTKDTARILELVGNSLEEDRPDAMLLVGDRSETLAAATAATLMKTALVHLHGGEETLGAIDNAFRHAITKMSHLHLVSHQVHANRILQMGEDPASVHVVGAPGLDQLYRDDLPTVAEVQSRLGVELSRPVVLVTLHPTTLGASVNTEMSALIHALERVPATYVITQPNADREGAEILARWQDWARRRDRVVIAGALGDAYWTLLKIASAVVGNSSSGIIEAPAAGVPVVNIGDRQAGRMRYGWVRDVPPDARSIETALRECLSLPRPIISEAGAGYPSGAAAPRVVAALEAWTPPDPPRKCFVDWKVGL